MGEVKNYPTLSRPCFGHLASFHTSLQFLHLNFRAHTTLFGPTRRTLKKFTKLKDLYITTNLIYPRSGVGIPNERSLVDFLPGNIEKLTLVDCSTSQSTINALGAGIIGLSVERGKGLFPKLIRPIVEQFSHPAMEDL
ncbi:uncharacterized protein BKA55DRAFT_579227 [Fusarium redolens]|uniref:Uncharacterized protein n=1 Tax=Fusarium redolens TaxID=48865 RepID=A0A9P9G9E9_FUSRE|nr:uncharacterized protein BKA55DRAFT_579227 [Fusarium redolens]KAH7234638.1 hypothetical protein BKA55DRAFT_579227 [Fusarium redolens]